MHNPYSGAGFFEFFAILAQRLWLFMAGQAESMASDEVQLAVLACCAIACGLVGPFLVLKRMSMFANSLAHTSLSGIVIAFLIASALPGDQGRFDLSILLLGAGLSALLTAGLTEGLGRLFRLTEDASIGLVFTSLFAVGVTLVTLFTRDVHLSIEAVLGNPDALQISDLRFSGGIALLNLAAVLALYPRLLLSSFDESFGRTLGISALFARVVLFLLTALTCIGAFRAVGVLVVLALLVGPYLTARLFCNRMGQLLIWTPLLGLFACLAGVALSRGILSNTALPLSTSGIISTIIGLLFIAAVLTKRLNEQRERREHVRK